MFGGILSHSDRSGSWTIPDNYCQWHIRSEKGANYIQLNLIHIWTIVPNEFLISEILCCVLIYGSPLLYRLLIFGYGKRSCLGEVFARNRTFLFLATLLQTCNVKKPSGQCLTALDPRNMMVGVVLQPQPYKVQFELRK